MLFSSIIEDTKLYLKEIRLTNLYGTQFVRKLFINLCRVIVPTKFMIVLYHLQTRYLPEWFEQTVTFRLQHFVAKHHRDLDFNEQLLMNANSAQA